MSADIFQLYIVQTLGYRPSLVGIIAAAGLVSVPLQLLAPRFVYRYGHRRVMIAGALLILPALAALLCSALIVDQSRAVGAATLLLAAVTIEIAISISFGAAWTAWVAELTESSNRAIYVSLGSAASQLTIISAFLVQTLYFDGTVPTEFYQAIIFYCIVYVTASVLVFRSLPSPDVSEVGHNGLGLSVVRRIAHDKRYRLMLGAAVGNFLIGLPLLAVYAITILQVPSEFLGVVLVLRTLSAFFVTPLIGWLISRYTAESVIKVSGFALTVQMVLWATLPTVRDRINVMVGLALLVVVFQLCKGAFAIALATVEFETVDRADRVSVFNLIDLTSSTAMQINMLVGAVLVELSGRLVFLDNGFMRLDPVKISCIAGAVIAATLTVGYSRLARSSTKTAGVTAA